MRSIRRGVFETNSSSTHSLTIVSKEEYDAWKEGKLLFNKWSDEKFIEVTSDGLECVDCDFTTKENFKRCPKCGELLKHKGIHDDDYKSFERFWDDIDNETFVQNYKTKNGEDIVAFGYYG